MDILIEPQKSLTKYQRVVYNAIEQFIRENGYSPTVREICKIAALSSTSTVQTHLKILKQKSYIDYVDGQRRTIVLKIKKPPIYFPVKFIEEPSKRISKFYKFIQENFYPTVYVNSKFYDKYKKEIINVLGKSDIIITVTDMIPKDIFAEVYDPINKNYYCFEARDFE